MAVSVLLLSNDPHLGSSLEALAPGLLRVRNLEPSRQPATWPGRAGSTVVLDLAAGERATAYSWVRQHHAGRLIVLLRPGEQASSLPPDPDRLVLRRPLGLSDLVEILSGLDSTNGPAGEVPSGRVSQPTSGQKPAPAQGNLLQASAKQRGLRLGSLSSPAGPAPTATPGPLVAGAAGGAMPVTEPAAQAAPPAASPEATAPGRETSVETASQTEAARPATRPTANGHQQAAGRPATRPERRRLTLARGVVLGALGVVVIFGVWLALGLLQAREDLGVEGAGLRAELVKAHAALGRGDPDAAQTAIRTASRNLDAAEAVTARRPMRVAARLPVLGGGVSDVRHLLAAARNLTRAAEHAVVVSDHLKSGRFAVLKDGRFDLEALDHAAAEAKDLVAELDRVRAELAQVRGGPLAPGADQTKRWALARLDEATARARPLVPTLQALPGAVGAVRPQTYLVARTNTAELPPGGGVPLAVLEVTLDKGVVRVVTRDGEIVENVHNAQATWPAVAGDPWARGGRFNRFSLANSSPHFPTSGQELLRAYAARGRPGPDGVISLDPLAMRALLGTTGPVNVPGYGRLTAGNCVRLTTHDAYVRWPDRQQRRRYNEVLLDALIQRLLSGRNLVATGKVLGDAGARRQVQIYATDPQLQRALTDNGMYGGQSPAGQDYLAVYTLNANSSRMDYFQRRSIHQVVQLRPDGSAEVTRTIKIENRVPPSEPIQDGANDGYNSGRVTAVVANYLPPGATPEEVTHDDRPVRRPTVVRENGRLLVRLDVDLAPGQDTSVTVRYLTPKAAPAEGGFRFRLTADPQVLIRPPGLLIDVVAPPGKKLSAGSGWVIQDDGATATLSGGFTDTLDTTFDVHG